ncbi:adenine-specific DNA-methyltransferase [Pantoea sp. Nvir]|uniref:adenine-specific DNA-methyltransferase n=1 Tax=Pantoea sp. Nvir TaxID=2576760 RepID=UPI00135C9B0F|nr:adenine-specific DNA-methyltransferase [Pantoea sp. Nvir]MXP66928.1 adenine-specific DNA-methyltransferase [Pantoea sp. Nvir]CAJ0992402.1 DNA adenine methylase [Pantoea sp. Nvir]
MKKNRAFLKWAGGKYPLMEDIRRHLPQGECLIEPFVGAGSVFLNTNYERNYLADINNDLINLYNIVKNCSRKFIQDARRLFSSEGNTSECYYLRRVTFNASRDIYERALLFLYLNRHGYNGLCRYNLRGEFNVPFGSYRKPYFPEAELLWFAERAQKATFVCESYDVTLTNAQEGAVVYCDPPYASLSTTANFTAYHTHRFSLHEQKHLAELASQLALKERIPVLISNQDNALTRLWYQDAILHIVKARRSISRHITSRIYVDELLALYC